MDEARRLGRPSLARRLAVILMVVVVAIGGVWFGARAFHRHGGRTVDHLPDPDPSALQSAMGIANAATVKVAGTACGLSMAGSGVVVAAGTVMTAAHVVAGTSDLRVVDSSGAHRAVPVVVDPLADLAVLYSADLTIKPIIVSIHVNGRGTPVAVVGYPHGGERTAQSAVILDSYPAQEHDLYQRQVVQRQVLEIQARVEPGSSGGPVVDTNGSVIGIVFGQSETDARVGYAVASPAIATVLREGVSAVQHGAPAVSTGACLPNGEPPGN